MCSIELKCLVVIHIFFPPRVMIFFVQGDDFFVQGDDFFGQGDDGWFSSTHPRRPATKKANWEREIESRSLNYFYICDFSCSLFAQFHKLHITQQILCVLGISTLFVYYPIPYMSAILIF